MRFNFIAAAAAASLGLFSVSSQAADNGVYLGASVGQSSTEYDQSFAGEDFSFDASSTGFKAIAGWRFLDWLAVEGNYVDLGSGDDNVLGEKIETDINGVSLSAVGFLPVGPVDLFARVGAINWNADLDAPGLGISGSDDGTDLTYGDRRAVPRVEPEPAGRIRDLRHLGRRHRRHGVARRHLDVPVT